MWEVAVEVCVRRYRGVVRVSNAKPLVGYWFYRGSRDAC